MSQQDSLTEVDVNSDHMRLSITSQAERSLYVRLQVFLSKHLNLLSSNTNQKSSNRRSKRQLLEDITLKPNVYNGWFETFSYRLFTNVIDHRKYICRLNHTHTAYTFLHGKITIKFFELLI